MEEEQAVGDGQGGRWPQTARCPPPPELPSTHSGRHRGTLSLASWLPRALEAPPEFNKVIKQLSPGNGRRQLGDRQLPEQRCHGVQSMQTGLLPDGPVSPPIKGLSKYKTPEGGEGGTPGCLGMGGGRVVRTPQTQPPPLTPPGVLAPWPHPRKTHMHSEAAWPGAGLLAVPSEARSISEGKARPLPSPPLGQPPPPGTAKCPRGCVSEAFARGVSFHHCSVSHFAGLSGARRRAGSQLWYLLFLFSHNRGAKVLGG